MRRVFQLVRFGVDVTEATADVTEGVDDEETLQVQDCPNAEGDVRVPQAGESTDKVLKRLTQLTWDSRMDNEQHPDYEAFFSKLLLGNRYIYVHRCRGDQTRRQRNGRLAFPRGIDHDLSTKKDTSGRSDRSKHFENRLLRAPLGFDYSAVASCTRAARRQPTMLREPFVFFRAGQS